MNVQFMRNKIVLLCINLDRIPRIGETFTYCVADMSPESEFLDFSGQVKKIEHIVEINKEYPHRRETVLIRLN